MNFAAESKPSGLILFPGRGDNLYAHLNVADAARALIRAAEIGLSGVMVVADNLPCTWNQLFYATQTYYPRLKITHIPKALALLGTGLMDLVHMTVSIPNLYSVGAVRSWNLNLPVDWHLVEIARHRAALPYHPRWDSRRVGRIDFLLLAPFDERSLLIPFQQEFGDDSARF